MQQKHWIITVFSLVLLVALLLPACAQPAPTPTPTPTPAPTPTPVPVVTKSIKFQYTMPPGSAVGSGFEWWAKEFTKRSNGKYKVETYPLSGLVPDKGALDAVKGGVCEVIQTSTGSQSATFPLSAVTGQPTLCFHKKAVTKEEYLASFAAWKEFMKVPEIAAEYKDYMVRPVEIDPSYLVSKKKEIKVPDDLAGLKVGSMGSITELLKAYGAAGVFQIPPDTYMNLDKGVTDASFNTYAQINPYKLYEIAKYVLKETFNAGALLVLTNQAWYNALSADDKKMYDQSWEDAMNACADGMYNESKNAQPIVDSKMTIIVPTAEQSKAWEAAAAKYAFPKWAADAQKLGASAATTDKILKAWQDLMAKYTTQK